MVLRMDTINSAVAEVIRATLREAKQSGSSMAKLLGIASTTWTRKIHGHTPGFTFDEVYRIALLLNLKPSDLAKEVESRISERVA